MNESVTGSGSAPEAEPAVSVADDQARPAMEGNEGSRNSTRAPKQPSSASLFTWAGVCMTAGNLLNAYTFGPYHLTKTGLVLIVVSLPLALWGMQNMRRESLGDEPVHGRDGSQWLILTLLVVTHLILAVPLCLKIQPWIDTYTFARDSCKMLFAGIDPYGQSQPYIYTNWDLNVYGPGMIANGRVLVGYQYPPLSLLWVVPGYLLGDVRYSYILAVVLSGLLIFAAYPSQRSLGAAAILLLNPITVLVELKCWTEPLVLLGLCATVYVARRHPRWLPIMLGLFLATKQYNILALPFAAGLMDTSRPFSWKAYWRLVATSCGVAALTLLPFAIWNLRGLWHDVFYSFAQMSLRRDAMSLAVAFPFLLKVGPLLLLAYLVWAVRAGEQSVRKFVAGYAVALTISFLFGKQAFSNYYFLIAQLFFLYPALTAPAFARSSEQVTLQAQGV
jgi:hypothetical protein